MKYPSINRRAARVNLMLFFFECWSGRTHLVGSEATGGGSRNRRNRLVAVFSFKALRAGLEVIKSLRAAILLELIDISEQNRSSSRFIKSTPLEMKKS